LDGQLLAAKRVKEMMKNKHKNVQLHPKLPDFKSIKDSKINDKNFSSKKF
jgi:hypothetical protein